MTPVRVELWIPQKLRRKCSTPERGLFIGLKRTKVQEDGRWLKQVKACKDEQQNYNIQNYGCYNCYHNSRDAIYSKKFGEQGTVLRAKTNAKPVAQFWPA